MRRALCLSIGLAFGACALPSADEFARGTQDAGSSSSSSSSGAPSETGPIGSSDSGDDATLDSGSDGGAANFMKNPDFEDGTCGTAGFYQGAGGISSTAHGGMYGCQACRQDESTTFYTYNPYFVALNPSVGQTYYARAWVKLGQDSFEDQQVSLFVRSANNDPAFEEREIIQSPSVALGDTWQLLEMKLTLTKTAQEIDFFVGATTPATAGQRCFVVDDVGLFLE
jgi:hypothetical protein